MKYICKGCDTECTEDDNYAPVLEHVMNQWCHDCYSQAIRNNFAMMLRRPLQPQVGQVLTLPGQILNHRVTAVGEDKLLARDFYDNDSRSIERPYPIDCDYIQACLYIENNK